MQYIDIVEMRSSFVKLKDLASELNIRSSSFNGVILELNHILKDLALGITAWVEVKGNGKEPEVGFVGVAGARRINEPGQEFWVVELGYAKALSNKWGLYIRYCTCATNHAKDAEVWPYQEAPRHFRVEAVTSIPNLLAKLFTNGSKHLSDLAKKEAQLKLIVDAITEVTEVSSNVES